MLTPFFVKVTCPFTTHNQVVKLVGSTAQLGNWNPILGLTLYTTNEEFPVWKGNLLLDVQGQTLVEYKYVIVSLDAPGDYVWENFTGNRRLAFAGKQSVTVQDRFDEV